ncbi:MAG: L,D-transpeptidase family protein [Candidatus Binatia bacterium]
MKRKIAVVIAAGILVTAASVSAWEESDFPPRPVAAYGFTLGGPEPSTVIGEPRSYTFARGDTLHDVARHLGLGINEVTGALPEVDVWLPPEGETMAFPTWWVLPDSAYEGVVVNIPEMRLYYFSPHKKGALRTAITYPVGLGRDEWRTPTGKFKVTEKTVNPKWVVPESIREEHIRERGDPRRMIPGGAPDNPLGRYRIRLSLPLYGIHGTNIPWGVGMEVSHGCIRLYPEDIERLFTVVPVGVAGEIVYEPVKIGTRDGDVFVEVHPDIYETGFDYLAAAREQLHAKGWESAVNMGLLLDALTEKSGTPSRISVGQPLRRRVESPATEAERQPARVSPRS